MESYRIANQNGIKLRDFSLKKLLAMVLYRELKEFL
jgi:hypothetical protein